MLNLIRTRNRVIVAAVAWLLLGIVLTVQSYEQNSTA